MQSSQLLIVRHLIGGLQSRHIAAAVGSRTVDTSVLVTSSGDIGKVEEVIDVPSLECVSRQVSMKSHSINPHGRGPHIFVLIPHLEAKSSDSRSPRSSLPGIL